MSINFEYQRLSLVWSEDKKTRRQRQHSRDKRPVHRYTPEEFGLVKEKLQRDFAEYREHFILSYKSSAL